MVDPEKDKVDSSEPEYTNPVFWLKLILAAFCMGVLTFVIMLLSCPGLFWALKVLCS